MKSKIFKIAKLKFKFKFKLILFSLFSSFALIMPTILLADTDESGFQLDSDRVVEIFQQMRESESNEDYYLNDNLKINGIKSTGAIVTPTLDQVISLQVRKMIDAKKQAMGKNYQKISSATAISASALGTIPLVDLREFDSGIKEQFGGTCTTFGLTAAIENFINHQYQVSNPLTTNLSERHLWSNYGVYDSESAIKAAKNNYTTTEEYWPQTNKSPNKNYQYYAHSKLLAVNELQDDINKTIAALNRGNPVFLATSTSTGMSSCAAVINPNSARNKGGHALAIVGYRLDQSIVGGGYFIIKNSWGNDCGDNGYQYLPFYHCQRSDMYCVMWEIKGVETEYGEQSPVIFSEESVTAKFSYYKKALQTYYRISLFTEGSRKYLKQIESITYTLANSNLNPKVISGDAYINDFVWNFQSKRLNFSVKIEIKLKSGEVFTQEMIVK